MLHGGRLVSIYSATQNADVRAAVDAAGVTNHVWLGGSDVASEGVWTWTEGLVFSNGGTAANGAFINWCATAHRSQMPANALSSLLMIARVSSHAQVGFAA